MKDFYWVTKDTRTFMSRGYLRNGVSVEERVRQISDRAEELLNIPGFSDKFYSYMAKGWYSLSTPIWCNFGLETGLPISCFGSYVPDSMDGIAETNAEIMMMSKYGGGTSSFWGDVRERGAVIKNNGLSEGPVNFMRLFDTSIDVSKQGESRRGIHAVYINIDHPDIEEFLDIRGDGNLIQNLFNGVCVKDEWMVEMINGDKAKRKIWARVLEARAKFGTPYIVFIDNVNNNTVDVYRDKGFTILASNVCTEIALPSSVDESFVCDLSSVNELHYDEWKGTDAVKVLIYFLDAVMTEFIEKAKNIPFLERAVRFAERHRALGLGTLGHFSYLQSKMIPFESHEAEKFNEEIFEYIRDEAYQASKELAEIFGEPEVLKGYGRRNTTLTTLAPTTSSAFILGQVSQSIEPPKSNYYVKDLAKIKVTVRNPYLEKLLEDKGKNNPETWDSILLNNGSVQHLDFLEDREKAVFKTFSELSQVDIIRQAAARQKYIDQSQSLNLMIHPKTPIKDVNKLYIDAWSLGVKSLYYAHSVNAAQEFRRELVTCSNCEA
jgi:ribonucleoside-diphosphate reductase alpha chain